jgi:peptidoglycan/xylan/chitin deacetylase (PgdA/CDA1 family)
MNFVCLAYHQITAVPAAQTDPYTMTPACFEAQMDWLARHGFRGVSLGQAVNGSNEQRVAITFDDGYRDFYTTAWPILRRYAFTATLFIVTRWMGQVADWPEASGSPLLSWPEVHQLAAQGIEVGIHGATHQAFDQRDTAVLPAELTTARRKAAKAIGLEPVGLAYPYGRYSPAIIEAAQAAGFAWAATARGGKNKPTTNLFTLRRTLMTGQDGTGWRFALKVRTGYAKLVEWRMDVRQIK